MSSRSFGLLGYVERIQRQIGRILFFLLPDLAYGHCDDLDLFLTCPRRGFWIGLGRARKIGSPG